MKRLYLSVPHMGENEERYVTEAFRSNWMSTVGPNLDAFEAAFTARVGSPCVALGSGTAAIHLALRLAGVSPGDEVIVPSLTFIASVNPVRWLGGAPVFIDSERASWNLDPQRLDDHLRQRAERGRAMPRVVMPVHLYGQTADMDPILAICARYDITVVEDAAEAVGSTYKGRPAGTLAPGWRTTTSPGTSAIASISRSTPSRTTCAEAAVCARSATSERSALHSVAKPMSALITITPSTAKP